MAKRPPPLKNRLARHATDERSCVVSAALRPTDENRTLGEVCWTVLSPVCELDVADADEMAVRVADWPTFGSDQATGWVAGVLGTDLVFGTRPDPLADPKLRILENDVIAAVGPDAVWCANGEHPIASFRSAAYLSGWTPITTATFELVLLARGNGLDLVLARCDED